MQLDRPIIITMTWEEADNIRNAINGGHLDDSTLMALANLIDGEM